MAFGILADALVGVRAISRQDIHPALPPLTAAGARYIQGVTGDRVVVLDAQRLLSDKNIIVHEEVEL
jgi:purine-binding chemotaxis protein CheW